MKKTWGDKPYHSLDYYLKQTFGEKVYKVSLNTGCTCPNRDGSLDTRGCIFCSSGGSGDFTSSSSLSITEQIEAEKLRIGDKYKGSSYIAYFQAFTNTYGNPQRLESLYLEAANHPDIKAISIATRGDCLPDEIIDVLCRIHKIKPVWIELGLQTIHEKSIDFIRRGYSHQTFDKALNQLNIHKIPVVVHMILGLPGESQKEIYETLQYINQSPIWGVKISLLYILKQTDLGVLFEQSPFCIPSLEEYLDFIGFCIGHLDPDIVIHRLTGDGPKNLLIEPKWTANKKLVLNRLHHYLKEQDIWQGKELK
ncbi:radical SAM protein (TIGR01212 family) [Aequitasia blattaphilus]|uniref:TIGR01212 family radical SAM protein n=1 Tax=Aequitasia blattaphilus TaxID=2949332 RepID=A0ABT1ECT8_9FIRM|nr:TIGR01212 family radical SAM protein [Aequitasia blattaphilus]MCP1102292.1 TIGR01212 family radical SAM protein [Aequitasia blattaphilus]MCR8614932.1 TIGR01212 family radical SAM protein [Aequitasia blattaphilus]